MAVIHNGMIGTSFWVSSGGVTLGGWWWPGMAGSLAGCGCWGQGDMPALLVLTRDRG